MEATYLLPLYNLKLPRLQISDPLTRDLTNQPISSTYLPFKQNQPNFIFESQLIEKPKNQIIDPNKN